MDDAEFQTAILLVLSAQTEMIRGLDIFEKIEEESGQDIWIGHFYETIKTLEKEKLVIREMREPTPEQREARVNFGDGKISYFKITDSGRRKKNELSFGEPASGLAEGLRPAFG